MKETVSSDNVCLGSGAVTAGGDAKIYQFHFPIETPTDSSLLLWRSDSLALFSPFFSKNGSQKFLFSKND